MKTIGLFNNCVITAKMVFFCGETQDGRCIYADQKDIDRGFKLFTQYRLHIHDDVQDVPFFGMHTRASIARLPVPFQMPEWLRFEQFAKLLMAKPVHEAQAIAKTEGIVNLDRVQSTVQKFPSIALL